jgi:hypothetical protein
MAANSVRNGYIARIASGGQGVRFKAYLRAVTNVAMTFGALVGGLALWIDEPWAYLAVFVLDGATSIFTGLLFSRLPRLEPAPARAEGEPRMAVLRDLPYVVTTLLTAVLFMHFVVIEIGIPLWIDAPWAYLSVFVLDGATSIFTGLLFSRVPRIEPAPARAEGEPRMAVLRDLPFVVTTLLTAVLFMHFVVLEIGIPLWISEHTNAPTSMVAILLGVNTVAVALFQVRMSRGAESVSTGADAVLRGGIWIAASFVLLAFTSGVARDVAIPLLLVAGCVHVVGEMVSSSGQWGVSMGLAPAERQGQYQGFAGLAFSLSRVAAPTLITVLCIEWGRPGWFVLGGLILAAALAMKPVSAWALATREKYGAATATG